MSMSVDEFIELVGSQFFTACFIKRTDGTERVLNGRLRVKKHLKGGDKAYNFSSKGLVSVYDVRAKGYRAIPMDSLLWVRARGQTQHIDREAA
jgi:hypothetical protein